MDERFVAPAGSTLALHTEVPRRLDQAAESSNCTPENALRWGKLRKISAQLYGAEARAGRPSAINCSPQFIVVGTESAAVLVFQYSQTLVTTLTVPNPAELLGPVATIAISANESGIAVGFANGAVAVWNIEKPHEPLFVVYPSTRTPSDSRTLAPPSQSKAVHPPVPIVFVDFLGPRASSPVIAVDSRGGVCTHHSAQLLLLRQVASRRLRLEFMPGSVLLAATVFSVNPRHSREPLVLALVSSKMLEFMLIQLPSTSDAYCSSASLQYPRSATAANASTGFAGAVAWFQPSGQLAVSFSNQVLVFSIRFSRDDASRAPRNSIALVSTLERAYTASFSAVSLHWVTENILAMVSVTQQLIYVDMSSMSEIVQDDLTTHNPLHHAAAESDIQSLPPGTVICDSFAHSLKFQATSVFLLGKHELVAAQPTQWADQLMALLNSGDPAGAVRLALDYWRNGGAKATLAGLPARDNLRKASVKSAFPEIVITALKYHVLDGGSSECAALIQAAVFAVAEIGLDMLPMMLEIVEPAQEPLRVFCEAVVTAVFENKLQNLDPHVAQVILARIDDRDALQALALRLDPAVLDMDWLAREAAGRGLEDLEIYILSHALRHWTAPLQSKFGGKRYPYLAYSLTGRIWPTGDSMSSSESIEARRTLISELFYGQEYKRILEMAIAHPLNFFRVFNEVLESDWLNSGENEGKGLVISRQSIVDTLFSVVDQLDAEKPESLDRNDLQYQFAVFLARQYAKYTQFLIVTGWRLEAAAVRLCTVVDGPNNSERNQAEAQLALMALLSVYVPENTIQLIDALNQAGYWQVLELVYSRSDNWRMALKCAIKVPNNMNLWGFTQRCLANDRAGCTKVILDNISIFVTTDVQKFVTLVLDENLVSLFDQILELPDATQLKVLTELYKQTHQAGLLKPPQQHAHRYVSLLARLDKKHAYQSVRQYLGNPSDIQISAVMDDLLENDCIDVICFLLSRRGRESEAMIYLTNFLSNQLDPAEDTETVRLLSLIGADLCIQVARSSIASAGELWLKLIMCLLEIKADPKPVFQILISTGLENGLAVKVVAEILQGKASSMFGSLTKNVFVAISLQQRFIENMHGILASDLASGMSAVMEKKLKGWALSVDSECEVCGQRVVGLGIESELLYAVWEEKLRKVSADQEDSNSMLKAERDSHKQVDTLVVFACSHAYHLRCLTRMSPGFVCISRH